jgi:hypothetical protein
MTTTEQISDHVPTVRELLNLAGLDYRRPSGVFAAEMAGIFVLGLGIGAAIVFVLTSQTRAGVDTNGPGTEDAFGPPVSPPGGQDDVEVEG